jgi:hypothetical protein
MTIPALCAVTLCLIVCTLAAAATPPTTQSAKNFVLDYDTSVDPVLQSKLEAIDAKLREQFP